MKLKKVLALTLAASMVMGMTGAVRRKHRQVKQQHRRAIRRHRQVIRLQKKQVHPVK